MTAPKLCVDLCSGLGGFSQAFIDDPNWEVITVDIEEKFHPTICIDVRDLGWSTILSYAKMYLGGYKQVVILASPPCNHFSLAGRQWPRPGIRKAFEVAGQCGEIIADARIHVKDYRNTLRYAIENPKGRLRWFLGIPDVTLKLCDYGSPYKKLTDLWTNISLPLVARDSKATNYVHSHGNMNAKNPKPSLQSSSEELAKLPYRLSKAVLEAVSA